MTPSEPAAQPRALVLPVVLSATFVQLLNVTIAQVAAPAMQQDLGANSGALQLVVAGYTLTYACLLLVAARLGERYGYRRVFVVGMAVFALGSAACAVAPSAGALVAARLVQGAGSGLVAPQVLSLIRTALPSSRQARALGAFGATMAVASLAGPLLGGLVIGADLMGLGWRPIFLVTLAVSVVALAGAVVLPPQRTTHPSPLDGLGAVLATSGFGLFVLPLALGREAGWPGWTWACLAGAALALGAFAVTQRRRPDPLVHPAVYRDRTTRSGLVLVFVFNAGVPSFTFLLFLHLQSALGHSALTAALFSAPFAAAAVIGSRAAPRLSRRHGTRLLTAAALVLAAVMAALGAVIGSASHGWVAPVALAAGGAAFGAFTASAFTVVLAQVDADATASAAGLLPTAQQLGGSIGVTLAGLVYFAVPADLSTGFRLALLYEGAVFLLTAALTLLPGSAPGAVRKRTARALASAADTSPGSGPPGR
ncbi:MFS transporter [Saccharothrix sp. Mg75]|uniref:MFS transporter n=1 Tax=Saccharothrix sp. Mg75 TaxID=3445357 RepID=UPI003EEF7730